MVVWQLDLQLSSQSVPITTKVVSFNPAHSELYTIQHFVIKDLYPGTPVPSTNKADRHDINEIYLKVALDTNTLTPEGRRRKTAINVAYLYSLIQANIVVSMATPTDATLKQFSPVISTLFQSLNGVLCMLGRNS